MNPRCPECNNSLITASMEDITPFHLDAADDVIQKWFCSRECRDTYVDRVVDGGRAEIDA